MHNLYTVIKYEILHFYGNLSKFSYLSQIGIFQHIIICNQCYISVLSVLHQCLISVTPTFNQCYIDDWSLLHQCLISLTLMFNQCYIGVWSLLHQCLISVTPVFNQCSNGVWSFVYSFSNVKSVSQRFDEILNVFTISEFIFAVFKIEKSIELQIITMHKFIISFFCGLVIIKTDNHKIEQVKNMTIFVKIDTFCCTLFPTHYSLCNNTENGLQNMINHSLINNKYVFGFINKYIYGKNCLICCLCFFRYKFCKESTFDKTLLSSVRFFKRISDTLHELIMKTKQTINGINKIFRSLSQKSQKQPGLSRKIKS
ncbi:hypothetical protein KUTeg_011635 [Tegillarca granosa]|uniref:Uncharacterized protein n=1 Tax=Tegillarca granosa TaxID=220873 RepID=A0ABQ9EX76_TEGGR|nr:hypothetical protein KUTeg_011635 [Tegillarca granosa]